jgi:hypothetical protein
MYVHSEAHYPSLEGSGCPGWHCVGGHCWAALGLFACTGCPGFLCARHAVLLVLGRLDLEAHQQHIRHLFVLVLCVMAAVVPAVQHAAAVTGSTSGGQGPVASGALSGYGHVTAWYLTRLRHSSGFPCDGLVPV